MSETAVAYAISLAPEDPLNKDEGIQKNIRLFTSSDHCRTALQKEPPTTAVIVCNGQGVVSSINLAAALCADEPERDVYLMEDNPTEALANRVRMADIRGIVSISQAQLLLDQAASSFRALPQPSALSLSGSQPVSSPPRPALSAAAPTGHRRAQGSVVGFFSGRGGVGKSTVALMVALAAQKRGARVALVDLDLQFGDIGFLAGNEPSSRMQRLQLEQLCNTQNLPPLAEETLTLVLAPERPEEGEQFASGILPVLESLAAEQDIVILNTGTFWSGAHAQAVQRCDHLVFLMDQRATSIEACKQVVDLCLRLQAPQVRFAFALNGCGRHASLTPQDVSLALGGVEVLGLADGGALVDDLLALGCPQELLGSGNAFVASIENLLDQLIGSVPLFQARRHSGLGEQRGANIFDFSALKGFLRGAHSVAS